MIVFRGFRGGSVASAVLGDPGRTPLDSRADLFYKPVGHFRAWAQVAQLVEQRTENPRVGGSIPPLGTIFPTKQVGERIRRLYSPPY